MVVELTTENILLIGSVMLIFSIMIVKAGFRFGVPSLLVFLAAGMFMGVDGLGISFQNYSTAQFIGIMSLSIILFSGGVDTKFSDIRPVLFPGVVLATFGVVFTAGFSGAFFLGGGSFYGGFHWRIHMGGGVFLRLELYFPAVSAFGVGDVFDRLSVGIRPLALQGACIEGEFAPAAGA